jgi:hypothetical protein
MEIFLLYASLILLVLSVIKTVLLVRSYLAISKNDPEISQRKLHNEIIPSIGIIATCILLIISGLYRTGFLH